MMPSSTVPDVSKTTLSERMAAGWERFWFTPGDPTTLCLIRLCCGLVTLYTISVYSFDLQEFFGPNGWYDLKFRMELVRDRPYITNPISGLTNPPLSLIHI